MITGLAGAGVSAVATEWAHQVAEEFPDGQVVLDFSTGLPPGDALGAALRAVGCDRPPVTAFERVGLWRTLTRKRRLLVLADGASTADQLRPLLPAGPGGLLLATTRRTLPEMALNGAHTVTIEPLADHDAADLLARLLDHSAPQEEDRFAEAVAACSGMPLAVAALAGRLRLRGPALDPDAAAEICPPEDAVIDQITHTVAVLPEQPRKVFAALGLHPAATQRIDTEEAVALADLPANETARNVEALAEAHLLTSASAGGWRMYAPVAACAQRAARGLAPEEAAAAVRRLVEYLVQAATAADRAVNPNRSWRLCWGCGPLPDALPLSRSQGLDWFDAREPTLHSALQLAHEAALHEETVALAEALRSWMHARRPQRIWARAVELGTASADALDAPGLRAAMALMGHVRAMAHGRFTDAAQEADQARLHAERAGALLPAASAWQCRGSALRELGHTSEAVQACREAVHLARHATARDAAVQRRFLAEALAADGQHQAALQVFTNALCDLDGTDPTQAGHVLLGLVDTYRALSDTSAAGEAARRALAIARGTGNTYQQQAAARALATLKTDTA
ncbi:hypothetical protein [Nocardiopsis coralliicola]